MTLNTFTRAIEESELENGTQAQILISLFNSSGYIRKSEVGISESAAKKWIDGTRNCKASIYFPDNKLVNPEGAYKFFRSRPEGKLKKLQQIFIKVNDVDSPIDCETNDMDRFCWSVVNQFLDLLKFQRIDMPTLKIFSNINEEEIDGNIDIEQSPIIFQKEPLLKENPQCINAGAQISIPQSCRVCFCCRNWNGDSKTLTGDIGDKYGECKALGKRVLASDGIGCDKFKENYNKITLYDIYRKNELST